MPDRVAPHKTNESTTNDPMKLSQMEERLNQRRAMSVFQMADTDGSGTIDAQEFAKVHHKIQMEAKDEAAAMMALEREKELEAMKAVSARKKLKFSVIIGLMLLVLLGLSVVANGATMFALLEVCPPPERSSPPLLIVSFSYDLSASRRN